MSDIFTILNTLKVKSCLIHPHGSMFVCDPPVLDTDIDYCVWVPAEVKSDLPDAYAWPMTDGWTWLAAYLGNEGFIREDGPSYQPPPDGSEFSVWRRGVLNLVIYTNTGWYDRHKTVTGKLKELNLLDKQDRVAMFKFLMHGEPSIRALKINLLARFGRRNAA